MDIQVPLNNLKFGQDHAKGINARVSGRLEGIEELAANLFARGQIENLVVKRGDDDTYYVSNGNRRLAAFHQIYGTDSDRPIPCTLREVDDEAAFEDSLTTAVTARQLHPVDQYEAFARLDDLGKSQEEIARQYGMTEKEVLQALALGKLSPKIRNDWRQGNIKTEVAQAFTLSLDRKTQEKLYAKLQKEGQLNVSAVREALGGNGSDAGALVNFVGLDAYQARGGTVIVDLFRNNHIVSDAGLLGVMVDERLQAECVKLVEAGWMWASKKDDLPASWHTWQVTKVKVEDFFTDEERALAADLQRKITEIENDDDADYDASYDLEEQLGALADRVRPRGFTAKQMSKLGCMVDVENDGSLIVQVGIARPVVSNAKAAAAAAPTAGAAPEIKKPADKSETPEEPEVSNALKHRLSVQLTRGTATALQQDAELALIVMLAAFASLGNVVRVNANGLGSSTLELTDADDLPNNIKLFRKMKLAERLEMVASVAANALSFENITLDEDEFGNAEDARAICNEIDPKALNAALRGAFDAKDYFGGVNKALCLVAIKEALGADAARQQANNPKADIAAFALENVPGTGWLPPQLRAKGYDGPPAKGKAVPKASAKAKSARKSGGAAKPTPDQLAAVIAKNKTAKKKAAPKKAAKKTAKKKSKR